MKNEASNILEQEFKSLLKIVLLGFIGLDFFSPLTFKFIASEFSTPEGRTLAFVVFKVLYITLPIIGYLSYLVVTKQYSHILLKVRTLPKGVPLSFSLLMISSLLAVLWGIMMMIPSAVDFFSEKGIVIAIIINSLIVFVAYLCFDCEYKKTANPYQVVRRKCLTRVCIGFLILGGSVVGLLCIHGLSSAEWKTTLYKNPFLKQDTLEKEEKLFEQFQRYDMQLKINAFVVESFLKTYPNHPVNNSTETANSDSLFFHLEIKKQWQTQQVDRCAIEAVLYKVNEMYLPINSKKIQKNEVAHMSLQLSQAHDFMTFTQFQIEKSPNEKQKQAIKSSKELLQYIQGKDLLIILILAFSLYVFYEMQILINLGDQKNTVIRSTLILYLLMFIQMLKPVNPNNINLKDVAWPFTYSNWYLPGYIQSIGTMNNTTINEDNRVISDDASQKIDQRILEMVSTNKLILEQLIKINEVIIRDTERIGNEDIRQIQKKLDSIKKQLIKIDSNTHIVEKVKS